MIEIEGKKKKRNINPKMIGIIVGVITFIVIFVVFITLPTNKSENNNNNNDNDNTPIISQVAVGETFELEEIKITILDYYFSYYAFDTTKSFAAGKGNVFLMVHAKLENPNVTRKKYDTITNNLYYITEKGEAKYNNTYYRDFSDWILASNYLEPLEEMTGYYTFSLPENVAPSLLNRSWYESTSKLTSTQGKNFEIRFQQNKTKPDKIIKVKL